MTSPDERREVAIEAAAEAVWDRSEAQRAASHAGYDRTAWSEADSSERVEYREEVRVTLAAYDAALREKPRPTIELTEGDAYSHPELDVPETGEREGAPWIWALREHLTHIEGEAHGPGEWAGTVRDIARAALRELDGLAAVPMGGTSEGWHPETGEREATDPERLRDRLLLIYGTDWGLSDARLQEAADEAKAYVGRRRWSWTVVAGERLKEAADG